MKKNKLAKSMIFALISFFVTGTASGCDSSSSVSDLEKSEYDIRFVNYDDSLLYETKTKKGAMPAYGGPTPTRAADAQYTYRFGGWDPALHPADSDQTYTAVYTTSTNTYIVIIDDGPPTEYEYGSLIERPTPLESYLEGDVYYYFEGWVIKGATTLWDFDTDIVKADVTLVAYFTETTPLNVVFKNYDGSILAETLAGSGTKPVYKGAEPTKPSTVDKTYSFSGWLPELGIIYEDTEYIAQFSEAARLYDIRFLNYNGALIANIPTAYGEIPVYQGQPPTRPDDNTWTYTFDSWTPELVAVTKNASYTAVYTREPLYPATVTINQFIDDETTPAYTESFQVPNHTTYTVEPRFHQILATDKNPEDYELKSSTIADIYLIAGQSNAAGYSLVSGVTGDKADNYPETTHVTYYGRADANVVSNMSTPVKFGLGPSANHFGPEVGMGRIIERNNPSGMSTIVKTAFGGSWLYDYQDDNVSKTYGNWCSPSMRGAGANPTITGKAYDSFMATISNAVEHYKDSGYMVRLGGMLWIQGEQESSQANSGDYGIHLEALINDLREDFNAIFDYNAVTAPFIVGKISSTFAGGHLGVSNVRDEQERIAAKMNDVYALETYEICDPITKEPKPGCYDKYHFSSDDMLLIGERAADLMAEKIVPEGTDDAINVLRKEVNGDTTFNIYFATRVPASYKVEYYFQTNENEYFKSSYIKTVESTPSAPFSAGDLVTAPTDIPSELTDQPIPNAYAKGWAINQDRSTTTGFVVSEGKLTLKLYFDPTYDIDSVWGMKRNGNIFTTTESCTYFGNGMYHYLHVMASTAIIEVTIPDHSIPGVELNHSYGGITITDGTLQTDGRPKSHEYGIAANGLIFSTNLVSRQYLRATNAGPVPEFEYDKVNHTAPLKDGSSSHNLTIILLNKRFYMYIDDKLIYSTSVYTCVVPAQNFGSSADKFMFGIYKQCSAPIGASLTLVKAIYDQAALDYIDVHYDASMNLK
jgi:hypothetical protein